MSARSPSLALVLRTALERQARALRVSLPGRIEKFDAATQLADVAPLLQESVRDEEDSEQIETLPVIAGVPVQFVGGGAFAATFPVEPGDPCLLVFSDRSLDEWIDRGGLVDPIDVRRHDLSDAVALLGLRARPSALAEFDASRAVFGNSGPRVACDGSIVHVGVTHGQNAEQKIVRGDAYRAGEDSFFDVLDSATTSAGSALATAGALIEAASVVNAAPVVGGGIAKPVFSAAAVAIVQAATALQTVKAALVGFKAQAATYLTPAAKVP